MAHDKVDWSRAPKNCICWIVDEDKSARWLVPKAYSCCWLVDQIPAPSFGFEGDWRNSLTRRPQE